MTKDQVLDAFEAVEGPYDSLQEKGDHVEGKKPVARADFKAHTSNMHVGHARTIVALMIFANGTYKVVQSSLPTEGVAIDACWRARQFIMSLALVEAP